uniref:Ion_trans domain-containing protein n=1 Tax=Panagrellus redivivus TaxID=6233 RepID=A0A7E4UWZ2_PANRE
MGRRVIFDDDKQNNYLEWAPPVRIIAAVTLLASTLDLLADFLLCARIYEFLPNFVTQIAKNCAYGYFFFTFISIFVYIFEMVDVCLTLKYDQENIFYARLAKSLVLTLEEVPLPGLLYILFTTEPRLSLANPVFVSSWIKLITLTWGIVKFTKLRFFWPLLPLNPKHDRDENVRRCFTFTQYRIAMIFVNICHALAIFIVINNLIESGKGGRPISVREEAQ